MPTIVDLSDDTVVEESRAEETPGRDTEDNPRGPSNVTTGTRGEAGDPADVVRGTWSKKVNFGVEEWSFVPIGPTRHLLHPENLLSEEDGAENPPWYYFEVTGQALYGVDNLQVKEYSWNKLKSMSEEA